MQSFNFISHLLGGLYVETMNAGAAVALALILNGYDIKGQWRRFLLFILIAGPASAIIYYFPQTFRIVSLVLMYYLGFRFYFRFSSGKTILAFFALCFIFVAGYLTFSYILALGFGITCYQYYENPLIILFFHLSYNIPIAFLAYLAHKRKWRLLEDSETIKISLRYVLPLAIQITLLTIIMTEQLFSYKGQPMGWVQTVNFVVLIFSLLMTFIITWRIIKVAAHEASTSAQEKLATELRQEIDVIKAQRHDFINHVQIIIALLQQRQKQELSTYLSGIEGSLSKTQ